MDRMIWDHFLSYTQSIGSDVLQRRDKLVGISFMNTHLITLQLISRTGNFSYL